MIIIILESININFSINLAKIIKSYYYIPRIR